MDIPDTDLYENALTQLSTTSNISKTAVTLPKRFGQKSSTATKEQEQDVSLHLNEYKSLMSMPRTTLEKNMSVAVYDSSLDIIQVTSKKGGYWIHLGYNNNSQTHLQAEEALYMMECGVLQVKSVEGVPWTIEKAYHTLFNKEDQLAIYQVFAHLRRSGYITQIVNSKLSSDTNRVIKVYKPQKSFKKSSPGEPDTVVIVTKPLCCFPSSQDIMKLKESYPSSEVQYAIVDGDNIAYYSLHILPSLMSATHAPN